ncbi:hypothetical protein D3C73_1543740 [compost metagenome]
MVLLQAAQLPWQVQDQHHPAVAQQCRPGQSLNAGKLRAQALDHNLATGRQAVDLDRVLLLVRMYQEHRQRQALAQQPWLSRAL